MTRISFALISAAALLAANASAQVTLTPVAGFGANGWMAPGSSPYLGITNTERGMAYNPTTGNLVLVSRANVGGVSNNVRILNGATGADLGGLSPTGITGGTFALNMCGVADDGSIYAANLSIFNATTNPTPLFKVYRWNDEVSGQTTAPLVAYSGTPGAQRIGDSFAVTGGAPGVPIQFAAAGSAVLNNGNVTIGSNVAVGPLDFSNTVVQYANISGGTTANNDYRLALTWIDGSTLIGSQGANARVTGLDPATQVATINSTVPVGGVARRAMDYAVIGGIPMLAVLDSNASIVTVLNVTDPANPIVMASATAVVGTPAANLNGTGSLAWGAINGTSARLYAMCSNQGIQAFDFSFGPGAAATTYGVGCEGLALSNSNLPKIGSGNFSLDVSNVPVFAPIAFVAFGALAINPGLDLTIIGMPGCFSYTSFDIGLFQTGTVINQIGSFVLPIPANTALAGSTLAAQGVSLSILTSLGLNSSNGLQFTVGF